MTGILADSDAESDDGRVFAQHQAILTVVHGILDGFNEPVYRWLDLACGKGQIIAHLDKHLEAPARSKIAYHALDASNEFLKILEGKAASLGLHQVQPKVGELSSFRNHYSLEQRFHLITFINAAHELAPQCFADLLADAILRLSPDGLLFIYDMESLPKDGLELGAITWTKPQVQEIINTLFSALQSRYRPTIGQWPHRSCNGWHCQIHRNRLELDDNAMQEKRDNAVAETKVKVKELLQQKREQCQEVLRSLTKFGEESSEEENQTLRQLYDFWALHLGEEGFE